MTTVIVLSAVVVSAAVVSALAHHAACNRRLALGLYVFIGLISSVLLLAGLALAFLVPPGEMENGREAGYLLIAASLASGLPLLRPVRRLFAAVTPMNPDSVPEMIALIVLLTSVVVTGGASLLIAEEAEFSPIQPLELVAQAVALVLIAYFSVGLFITRDFRSATSRLGLGSLTARQVLISLGLVIVVFVILGISGYLTELFQPELSQEIEERMTRVTRDIATVQGALILGISAGVGEEVLFRGAIQPRFGIVFTALVFTIIHVQYGLSFVMLGVFGAGLVFGWQRQRINTTAAIITHMVYNTLAVMIGTMA